MSETPRRHVHLIGVCGTGMGALAALFVERGDRVTGSDRAFHPPMGPALEKLGVETLPGWDPANLDPAPDLVVVGNVCRPDNPEARAAFDAGLKTCSFPDAMERLFLPERRSLVVAGTHGKTTTTSLLAFLLDDAGLAPGFLIGGVPVDFDRPARLAVPRAPFVVEGDEYDSAFFEKSPKFWRYRPFGVVLTSVEHDHIDIYPDAASYRAAFAGLLERIPDDGLLVAWAGDPVVRELARDACCRVRFYGLESDDCGDVHPVWSAAIGPSRGDLMNLDVYGGGTALGRLQVPLSGRHNARNVLAALALASEGAGADLGALLQAVPRFGGVRRRQELLAIARGVYVYEDFAHHPSAVRETLRGLQMRHPNARLLAAFEPRSATASRRLHQDTYPAAFSAAHLTLLAPVGRPEIADDERLDTAALAAAIGDAGGAARATRDLDELVTHLVAAAREGDVVVLMSNGSFGGIYDRVIAELATR